MLVCFFCALQVLFSRTALLCPVLVCACAFACWFPSLLCGLVVPFPLWCLVLLLLCSPVTFSSPAGILLPFPLSLPSLLRVYCSGFWFYVLLLVCVLVTGVWLLILLHACAAYYVFPCCALSL